MLLSKTTKNNILKAKLLVTDKFPNCKVVSVVDYKDLYVFVVEPVMLGLIAVNKENGNVFGFNPMLDDPDEYFKLAETKAIKL